jgi:outer membrane protein
VQVLFSEEQVRNSEQQIESTTQQLNLAIERLNIKIISQADYAQIKSQLASENLTLVNAISALAMAKVNLMQLMELPVSNGFEIVRPDLSETINENRIPVVQTVFDSALNIKPQIKSAAINKEIAFLDEKIAKSGYFPVLSANAGLTSRSKYTTDSDNEEAFTTQLNHSFNPTAGLTLSIPVYQRRQIKTSVALAKIGYENAELSETDTRNQLRKNIEQACQDVISAQSRYKASIENFNAMTESAALSDEKFKQGIINSVDYLVSKTTLIVAESQLLQSKYNLIFSYKILDFYAGIPLTL